MKTSIRFLAVIFAVAMMVLAFANVSANSFSDVKNDTPHAKAIDSLTSIGIIHGYEDGTFKPDLPVRRDEMAKLVYTTFTTYVDAGEGTLVFPDVAANSWAKGYISWCAGKKIVGGYEDGTFKPEGNVTYDEALKMVCAMLGYVDFNPEMWPVDVRLKALIDLNLGENLADVAGDAVLTRAQVAQIFHNALDEQMYVAPLTEEEKKKPQLSASKEPQTIAGDIWGYTEVIAEVVATENWGLVIPTKVKDGVTPGTTDEGGVKVSTTTPDNVDTISFTKTNRDDAITLRFLDTEGKPIIVEGNKEKVETVELKDLGLEAYVDNNDDLLVRTLNIFVNKKGEYISSTLKGKAVDSFTGGYSSATSLPEEEVSYTHTPAKKTGQRYHCYGIKIDGVIYDGDNFQAIKKLVYMPDGTVLAQPATTAAGQYYLDDKGNVKNRFYYSAWGGSSDPSKAYLSLSFPRALIENSTLSVTKKAIDSDGDGYYEYLIFNYHAAYVVESATKKQIKLKSAYSTATFTYEADKFHTDIKPKAGDIIVGYFVGDEFYHLGTANMTTAFATKYSKGGSSTSTSLYGYATYSTTNAYGTGKTGAKTILDNVIEAPEMAPYVGFDTAIGDYHYANYYIYNGSIIYATLASADDLKSVVGGQNRAILLFVDKPTEPQINEKTKAYETFYPAYLIINGKEELVNLKSTNAIDGSEAATIAQDGSMYRAYTKDGYVMYRNMLVSYTVDADGYYSLTTAEKIVPEEGEVIIPANNYYLTINSSTKVMSIVDGSDNVIVNKILADGSSIIYYPYTKKTTGAHEYIDFYLGSEIPKDFNKIELTGDTYLTYDDETGFYKLATAIVAVEGFEGVGSASSNKVDYKTDARYHLIATADSDATYDEADEEVYANYYFQGIYEGTEIVGANKEQEYSGTLTKALTAGIYAWDDEEEDYVAIDETLASYSVENIDVILSDMALVFTDDTAEGYMIGEDVKIIAIKDIPDDDEEEFLFTELTLEELEALLETIEAYNDEYTASEKLTAKIGTYVDDNKKTQVAYIIVDWVEYDEELEAYTFAGETK